MKNEPAITAGAVIAIVTALITLVSAFGLNLTAEQTAAILGVVAIMAPIATALHIRGYVTPTSAITVNSTLVPSPTPSAGGVSSPMPVPSSPMPVPSPRFAASGLPAGPIPAA